MSALTWRAVSSPDFTGSATMLKTMAEQLDKATSGLSTGLKDWQGARMSRAEDQIAQQASQYDSPEAYRAALASGQILSGVDQGLIGKKLIEAAAGQESGIAAREKQGAQYAAPEVENLLKQALLAGNEPAITALTQQHAKTLRLTNSEFADPLKVRGMINNSRVGNVERTIQNAMLNGDRPLVDSLTNNPEIAQLLRDTKSKFADPLNVDDMFYGRSVSDSKKRVGSLVSQMDNLVLSGNPDSARNMRNVPEVMKALIEANHPYADARNFENSIAGDAFARLENDIANTSLDFNKLEKVKAAMAAASGNPAIQSRIAQKFGNMLTPSFELAAAQQSGMQPPALDKTDVGASSPATDAISGAIGTGASRADRNANPGNLKAPAGTWVRNAPGFLGVDKDGFAKFDSPANGLSAMTTQLNRYREGTQATGGKPVKTVEGIIGVWSPVSDSKNAPGSTTNYIKYVAERLGLKPGDAVPAEKMSAMAQAMYEFESGNRGKVIPTKQETIDNAVMAQAGQKLKADQISAFDANAYSNKEVTDIENTDFASGHALAIKTAGNISADNFTQRDFVKLYKQYGWVETPASRKAREDNPKLSPVKERMPVGKFAVALGRSVEDSPSFTLPESVNGVPSFDSQRNKALDGGIWDQLTGGLRSNVFYTNTDELTRQIKIAGDIGPELAANKVKVSKALADASGATEEKLTTAATELQKAELLASVYPSNKEYAKLVATLRTNYDELKKLSDGQSRSRLTDSMTR